MASRQHGGRGLSRGLQLLILFANLLGHLVPSVIIGFGFVIPGSCIEGINPHTLGFIACLAGFLPTYAIGVALAWRFGRMNAADVALQTAR
jgi:ABC-type Fe3+ transport system permease subunit